PARNSRPLARRDAETAQAGPGRNRITLMATIHEQIDELLAADLHDELTAVERDGFHAHLVECAECRQAFQEGKTMNRILNETLAEKKADSGFEQRMISRFRDRVPKRS